MTRPTRTPAVPVLTDGVVTLRAPRRDDAAAYAELLNDPVNAEATEMAYPCTEQTARAMIEADAAGWGATHPYRLTVESPHGVGPTRYAGTVALTIEGAAAAEIDFSVHPSCRGKGLAKIATRLLVDWAFDALSLPAIRWRSQVGNYASWRVAWHLGFGFDTTMAAAIDHRGEPRDAWVATLKPDDPREPQSAWMSPIRIELDGLVLRDVEPTDEKGYLEALSDPESHRWLGTIPGMPRTPEEFRARMHQRSLHASLGQMVNWTVADRETDEYLASVTLFDFQSLDYKSAEVGYRTHPAARGKGVLTRSLRAVLAHAFADEGDGGLGLERISLCAGDGNFASQGVARSCGFTETGRDRRCYDLADGTVVDVIRFDLLRSEFLT